MGISPCLEGAPLGGFKGTPQGNLSRHAFRQKLSRPFVCSRTPQSHGVLVASFLVSDGARLGFGFVRGLKGRRVVDPEVLADVAQRVLLRPGLARSNSMPLPSYDLFLAD